MAGLRSADPVRGCEASEKSPPILTRSKRVNPVAFVAARRISEVSIPRTKYDGNYEHLKKRAHLARFLRSPHGSPGSINLGGHDGRCPLDQPIGTRRRLCARQQARQHPVQRLPHIDHRCARPRRIYRGLRSGDDRLAVGARQSAAASDRPRHTLARRRPDLHAVSRRLLVLGCVRPLESQDDHADRRGRHDVLHAADPAGANLRAADHRAPVDRYRCGRRRLGGVPDCRGIDAGAAPAHLRRDL
jgi:hypothetical protein